MRVSVWKEGKVLEELASRPLGDDEKVPLLLIMVERIDEHDYQFVYFGGTFEGLHRVFAKASMDGSSSSHHSKEAEDYLGKALFCTVGRGILLESEGLPEWKDKLVAHFQALIARCNHEGKVKETRSEKPCEATTVAFKNQHGILQSERGVRAAAAFGAGADQPRVATRKSSKEHQDSALSEDDAAAAAAFGAAGVAACGFAACAPGLAAFGLMVGNPIVLGVAVTGCWSSGRTRVAPAWRSSSKETGRSNDSLGYVPKSEILR